MYELLSTVLTFNDSMMMEYDVSVLLVHRTFRIFPDIDHIYFSCDKADPLIQRGKGII